MNFSIFSIKWRVFTVLTTIAAVVIGLFLFVQMPISYWPDFSAPVLLVNTVFPGASAEEVEDKVTRVIEEGITGIANVDDVESQSLEGTSSITIRFEWGTDMTRAASDLKEKLDLIGGSLPKEALKPQTLKIQDFLPPSFQFTLESDRLNEDELKTFFEKKLSFYFLKIKDVAAVEIAGGRDRFVAIEPDLEQMRRLGVTADALAAAFGAENLDMPVGTVKSGLSEFLVKTKGKFSGLEDLSHMVVAFRYNAPVLLKDMAKVRLRYEDERTVFKLNGRRTLGVSLRKKNDGNAVSLSDAAQEQIGRIKKMYPYLRFQTIKDESTFIRQSIRSVLNNTLLGAILAALVIFLFLGNIRNTLIISISMPVSIIASFIFMRWFGLTINTISLGGLALAVGMIVDASIVMLENIERNLHLAPGEKRLEVFARAAKEVTLGISGSTLTSLVVFIPLAFLKGIADVLLGELALTVIFTLSISLLVSLGLVPLLSYHLVRVDAGNALHQRWMKVVESLLAAYRKVLGRVIQKKKIALVTVGVLFVLFLLSMVLAGKLETELIPVPDEGEFRVEARFAPSTSLEANIRFSDSIAASLRKNPEMRDIFQVSGQSPTISLKETNVTTFYVLLKDKKRPIKTVITDTQNMLTGLRIPGALYRIVQSSAAEGMTRPALDIVVSGDELAALQHESEKIAALFRGYPGLANFDLSSKPGKTELQVIPDRERSIFHGLPAAALSRELRARYLGLSGGKMKIDDQDLDIKIIFPDVNLTPYRMRLNTASGRSLSLGDLARFALNPSSTSIRRLNQQRFAEVKAELLSGSKRKLDRHVAAVLDGFQQQSGLRIEKRGSSKGITESFRTLGLAIILAIFLVYVVLGAQFNSFMQPLIISFTIPLAFIGVIITLWLTATPLNLNAFLGGVVLVGIVVNNGILLVDFINQKREAGLEIKEAIIEGSVLRLKPVLMTALTTILGILPLAIGWGQGSESLVPLARAVAGGLTFSTFTTLLVVPALYLLITPKKFRVHDEA